jgi:hypothetical protein
MHAYNFDALFSHALLSEEQPLRLPILPWRCHQHALLVPSPLVQCRRCRLDTTAGVASAVVAARGRGDAMLV